MLHRAGCDADRGALVWCGAVLAHGCATPISLPYPPPSPPGVMSFPLFSSSMRYTQQNWHLLPDPPQPAPPPGQQQQQQYGRSSSSSSRPAPFARRPPPDIFAGPRGGTLGGWGEGKGGGIGGGYRTPTGGSGSSSGARDGWGWGEGLRGGGGGPAAPSTSSTGPLPKVLSDYTQDQIKLVCLSQVGCRGREGAGRWGRLEARGVVVVGARWGEHMCGGPS